MQKQENKIFIISGPSRVGKEVITNALVKKKGLNLRKVVTATTRPMRPGEVDGKDYYFLSKEEFERKIKEGYFLEWAILRGGNYFGTPVCEFDKIKSQNKNVIMNIDVQGSRQVSKMRYDVVRIFIKPDSIENLKRRMVKAGFSEDQIIARMSDMKREMKEAKFYDYVVENKEGKLNEAIEEVAGIIRREIGIKSKK